MSYVGYPSVEIGYFDFTFTGNISTNDYININAVDNDISGSSITGSNTLNLPAGDYLIKAYVGASRTNPSDTFTFQIESDSSLVGAIGAQITMATTREQPSDHAYAQISKTSSNSIKIKVISCTATSWTVDQDYGYLLIIRSF